MDPHYHLRVRTPLGNVSPAIRWLNVTYRIRFNWAHRNNRPSWGVMVGVAEKLRWQPWETRLTTHGNWGRDGMLFVAVRSGRHRLPELLEPLPGGPRSATAPPHKPSSASAGG